MLPNARKERINALQFVFCIMILVYHSNKFGGGSVYFAKGWYIGFEFFFLTSGFFLTEFIERMYEHIQDLNVWDILKRKIKKVYPCFFLSALAGLAGNAAVKYSKGAALSQIAEESVESFGNLLLLEMTGIKLGGGGYKAARGLVLVCPDSFKLYLFNFL